MRAISTCMTLSGFFPSLHKIALQAWGDRSGHAPSAHALEAPCSLSAPCCAQDTHKSLRTAQLNSSFMSSSRMCLPRPVQATWLCLGRFPLRSA